jgi:MFS family permease/quinol monooxygenase YgiN
MTTRADSPAATQPQGSAWSPLSIPVFRGLWIASLASMIGTWMHDMGAGWLMTTLNPNPVMVALVQTATTLPMFLLALPAGALADIVDRRRHLITVQVGLAIAAALLGVLTLRGLTTAWLLLALTFTMGIGTAMLAPAWAAVTPEVVPRSELRAAIALNTIAVNVARALGPALAGLIVAQLGTGAVFLLNAVSYVAVVIAVWTWRRQPSISSLPTERFLSAMRTGVRYARHAPALHAALLRGLTFFIFASALWALLPLVARQLVGGGPQTYGVLLTSMGLGAVGGAVLLPKVRQYLSNDAQIVVGSWLYGGGMAAVAAFPIMPWVALAMAVSGVAWITVLANLQIAAQLALPDWVRARGLAVFMTVFMGSMAGSSVAWGALANAWGIPAVLLIAGAGSAIASVLVQRFRIGGLEDLDLTPSMHWPSPAVHESVTPDRAPVAVMIEYKVRPADAAAFLTTLRELGHSRRRDGAYFWDVLEDSQTPNLFVETFMSESWVEHLRQHERVTEVDRQLQEQLNRYLEPGTQPQIRHLLGPARR